MKGLGDMQNDAANTSASSAHVVTSRASRTNNSVADLPFTILFSVHIALHTGVRYQWASNLIVVRFLCPVMEKH